MGPQLPTRLKSRRFGGDARAIYPVGGAIGTPLRQLLDREGIASQTWTIAGETREDFFVNEIVNGKRPELCRPEDVRRLADQVTIGKA